MSKRKHIKKNKPIARGDANQGIIEHNARIKKEVDYAIKKIAEYKAQQLSPEEREKFLAELERAREN